MNLLQQFAHSTSVWSLEQLVQIANQLLPQFLPQQDDSHLVQEEVNARLVRHYTTVGLIDKPHKDGREARYTYRHLLQLLVVRRLLREGYSAGSMNQLTLTKSNSDLEALLQEGVQLTVATANPALAFLQQLQARQPDSEALSLKRKSMPTAGVSGSPTPSVSPSPPWSRIEVIPGLEIHVREDFVPPTSLQEQQNLLQLIGQYLLTLPVKRRRSL